MSPLDAVCAGDTNAALAALAKLSPRERRGYAADLFKLHKAWQQGDFSGYSNISCFFAPQEAVRACITAVATSSELIRDSQLWIATEDALRVAQHLTPPWLNNNDLETLADAGELSWNTAEALVAAGLCKRPSSDRLVESMIEHLGFRSDEPLIELIREAPGLIEEGRIYRVFEVEGGQQSSLCAADKYRREENQWATALAQLSASGELDRGRLIDGCLDALARDFAAFRAGWFSRFHDRLKPSDDERSPRSEAYVRLLGSAIPATLSFSVKAVTELVKLQSVDAEALLRAIPPALHARQKGTVKGAAKLLQAAAKKVPSAVPDAIGIAIDALVHPAVDVQKALLDLIDDLMTSSGADQPRLQQRLAECADLLAPSLRSRLPQAAIVSNEEPPQVAMATCIGPLDDSLRIRFAESVEEALDRVAYALEHEEDPIAQEVALDAIARHGSPSDDWATLASPVRKRAQTIWNRDSSAEHVVQLALTYLALVWTKAERPEWQTTYADDEHDFEIYIRRIYQLADRLEKQVALPLLSTPTHQGGFVEAAAFHQRLKIWQSSAETLDPNDVVLALMRLPRGEADKARKALTLKPKGVFDLAAKPADFRYEFVASSHTSGDHTFHSVEASSTTSMPAPKSCLELRYALQRGELYGDLALTRWIATVTPSDLASQFAQGVTHLGRYNMDDPLATGLYLEAALNSWVKLGEAGHWLLMLCLAARGARAIELALDVAIDGVAQKRVDAGDLAQVLAALMPSGALKAKRLATTLSQVADASERHAKFVIAVIGGGLRGDPADAPRDLGALLSLLYELLVANNARLEDTAARDWLEHQKRGGQVAKFRKSILAL